MPKKVSKSGFYYFMLDYKERAEKSGRKFPGGLRDVQSDPKCTEAWNSLCIDEKNHYNCFGKKEKSNHLKLTTMGESVELLEKQKREQMIYEANMRDYIDRSIKDANKINNLDMLSFYFIHVNHYYTKIHLEHNYTDYIPAEYAVVEFSLKHGVKRIHHQIIKTNIQTGYTREYIEHSDATHKLPNDLSEAEENYAVMYNNLVEFLKPGRMSDKFPPLYTIKKMKTIVPCLLERMAEAAETDLMTFDLYSLEYLFGTLMGIVNINFPETAGRAILADAQLSKDAFIWTSNIECFYHQSIEGTGPYCSRSIVQHWAFTIADYCCPKLSIDMLPGVHCPLDSFISNFDSMKMEKSRTIKNDSEKSYSSIMQNRKKSSAPLTIIDYGKNPQATPTDNCSTVSSTSIISRPAPQKQMRAPKTMAKITGSEDDVPIMNNENFPAIGKCGKGFK